MATKKELLLSLLEKAWVYLQVDGRRPGVDLPEWLRAPNVTLQIGYDMPTAIPDLVIDDDGIRATLSFRRTPHACKIPWAALYAVTDGDGHGLLFPEDAPPEALAAANAAPEAGAAERAQAETPAQPSPTKKPRPSHLKLVP